MASEKKDFPYDYYSKIYQTDAYSCIPICEKIVLDVMKYKIQGIPDLSIEEISSIIGTEKDGTPQGYNVERINEHLKLTAPSLEFKLDFLIPKWEIILNEVNGENPFKKPVIMMIMQYDTHELNWMRHAVVLFKADNKWVTYFDPIYGECSEPTSKFYNQWSHNDRLCIMLKIGQRVQRVLEEYSAEVKGEN